MLSRGVSKLHVQGHSGTELGVLPNNHRIIEMENHSFIDDDLFSVGKLSTSMIWIKGAPGLLQRAFENRRA